MEALSRYQEGHGAVDPFGTSIKIEVEEHDADRT
jgi:hypothetical protein